MWSRHTQRPCLKSQNPLAKKKEKLSIFFFLADSGEHSNFSVKQDVCSIVERPFFNIKNQFVIARVPGR